MTEPDASQSIADVFGSHAPVDNPLLALRQYLPEQNGLFGVAVVSTVCWRLANLVPPYLLGVALDAFFTGEQQKLSVVFLPEGWVPESTAGQFGVLAGLFAGLVVLQVLLNAEKRLSWRWVQQSVLHSLRMDVYDSTQRLDISTFESEQTGDVMSVVTNDVNQLRTFLNDGAQTVLQVAVFFAALLAVMLALHWQLTVVILSFVPVMLLAVYGYQRLVEPRYDDRREAVGQLNGHLQTVIDGVKTVRAFTNESFEREQLADNSRTFWRADWRAAKLASVFFPARQLISLGVMLGIVVVGGWWAIAGPPLWFTLPLSPGEFVTFFFFGQMFVGQSARLGDIADTYTDAKASGKRVFGLLHYPTETGDVENAVDLSTVDGLVEFDDVTFRYPNENTPALDGVSFTAEPDSYVGLVGPTGAGKSTIRDADTILVLDDGGIRDRSDHEELLAADGLYAELWELHTGAAGALTEVDSTAKIER